MSETTNEAVPLEKMTPTQRESWRMTGEQPVAAETEPVKKAEEEIEKEPEPKEAEKVAASGAEETESGTVTKTIEEQKTDKAKKPGQMGYKDLRSRIAELEAQIAKGTKPVAADNEAKAKDDKKDEHPRPKSTDKKADGSPKYQTWEEYEDDLLEWRSEKDRASFKQESTRAQQDTQKQQLEQELQKVVQQRADEARKKYADFDEKALAKDLPVAKDGVLYCWIMDSKIGMDIAYHYGSHRDELEKFNKLSPFAQARELTRLEDKLSSATAKESDVKVVEAAAPAPKVTKAPPPAREIGGRGSASGDPEDSAVANGDFRAFRRAANDKDTRKIVVAARK